MSHLFLFYSQVLLVILESNFQPHCSDCIPESCLALIVLFVIIVYRIQPRRYQGQSKAQLVYMRSDPKVDFILTVESSTAECGYE